MLHQTEEITCELLAMREGALQLMADEDTLGEIADEAKRQLVFHIIKEHGAEGGCVWGCDSRFRAEAVTVMPVGEGAAQLDVTEMIVPCEF